MFKSLPITIVLILGLCSFTAFSQSLEGPQDIVEFYHAFKDWISQFNLQYGIEEFAVRFHNWKANYEFIREQNSKNLTFKLGMNHFAGMTPEEFAALNLGYNSEYNLERRNKNKKNENNNNRNDNSRGKDRSSGKYAGLPKSVDWRTQGAVTSVKNQGKCGSCWAFAASGALEGLYAIKNKKLLDFSEQQLMDCSASYGTFGCDGGFMMDAYSYTKDHGIVLESKYKYAGKVKKCTHDPKKAVFKNTGMVEVPGNDCLALKAAVAQQPVSVAIEAANMNVQFYQSGVITEGCSTELDHAVLIVGYDTDAQGRDYWIVKNSWGSKYGQNGYVHIAMGDQNNGAGLCGINIAGSYPTL